jgi:RNA polymerase sigma factor (TIGR02999 family)
MDEPAQQVTELLKALDPDDSERSAALLKVLYGELRKLAAVRMAQEHPDHTLQATALVHEAWLKLVTAEHQNWQNRAHFFGAAALAMRRILVDNARRRHQLKRGGAWQRISWEGLDLPSLEPEERVLAVDDALEELARVSPVEAQVVQLRFFAGLEHGEIAQFLGLSERTVHRYWTFAKVWLYRFLEKERVSRPADASGSPEDVRSGARTAH